MCGNLGIVRGGTRKGWSMAVLAGTGAALMMALCNIIGLKGDGMPKRTAPTDGYWKTSGAVIKGISTPWCVSVNVARICCHSS